MAVWAIADLHLAFGVPEKRMDAFGIHGSTTRKRLKITGRAL